MRALSAEGWEIGVHLNKTDSVQEILHQKEIIERLLRHKCVGCRVHYLTQDVKVLRRIERSGFLYDSSITFSKDKLDYRNMDCIKLGNLIIFPITIMDAYLFTYMNIREEKVVEVVAKALSEAKFHGRNFVTILWHVGSVRMRGGRAFFNLLDYIASREDITILRGQDACELALKRGLYHEAEDLNYWFGRNWRS
ncbi:polysaccharide deacetylase family protein [Thermococcus sp.]